MQNGQHPRLPGSFASGLGLGNVFPMASGKVSLTKGTTPRAGVTPLERAVLSALDQPRSAMALCSKLPGAPRQTAMILARLIKRGLVHLKPDHAAPNPGAPPLRPREGSSAPPKRPPPTRASVRAPDEEHVSETVAWAKTLTEEEIRVALQGDTDFDVQEIVRAAPQAPSTSVHPSQPPKPVQWTLGRARFGDRS